MRIISTLLTCLLLAGLSPAAPAASAAPPRSADHLANHLADHLADRAAAKARRVRVTLTATPTWVRKGRTVTLTGKVRGARTGTRVTIFQKNKGARRWVVEAVKRTNRKGRFTHREDVKSGDRTYRACVRRACGSVYVHMGKKPTPPPPPPPPPPPAQATSLAVAALSAPLAEAGQAFTISGTASSNLNGQSVQIQAYDRGTETWSAVANAGVQNGQWTATASVSTSGRAIPLRASFPGGVGLNASESGAVSIDIYGWYYLEDMDTVSGSYDDGPRELNGVTYPKSIAVSDFWNSPPEFNLSRSCLRLASTIGVSDYASSSTTYSIKISTDSVTTYTRTGMKLGQSFPIDVSLSGALRLRIEHIFTAGDDSDDLVLGDARVLCSF